MRELLEKVDPVILAQTAVNLESVYGHFPASKAIELALSGLLPELGKVALVSSFGADAVVLLHMAASIDPNVPIIFIDTKRLFPETLAYKNQLIEQLRLTTILTVSPTETTEDTLDPLRALFALNPDACCGFRKVEPLAQALAPFDAWITGRKRFQAATRTQIPVFEADETHIKINPLARWTASDILAYIKTHDLPPHPLVAKGYPSIGCAPCTSPVADGEDARAGRWRGSQKLECGLHTAHAPSLSAHS